MPSSSSSGSTREVTAQVAVDGGFHRIETDPINLLGGEWTERHDVIYEDLKENYRGRFASQLVSRTKFASGRLVPVHFMVYFLENELDAVQFKLSYG